MKYIINPAGNRIVIATPEETHALRPRMRTAFRCWRANGGDIEDLCQEVEIIVWRAIAEQRIPGNGFARPRDALLDFMFSVAWNVWRNHSRKRSTRSEVPCPDEDLPEVAGPSPEGRIDARETLLHLTLHEDIARVLIEAVNVPSKVRYANVVKSTYGSRLTKARQWVRDVDAGHWKTPRMPVLPKLKHRKKKR